MMGGQSRHAYCAANGRAAGRVQLANYVLALLAAGATPSQAKSAGTCVPSGTRLASRLLFDWKRFYFVIIPVMVLGTMLVVVLLPDIVLAWHHTPTEQKRPADHEL